MTFSKKGLRRSYSEETPDLSSNLSTSNLLANEKNNHSTNITATHPMYRSDSSEIDDMDRYKQRSLYGSIMTCGSIDEEKLQEDGKQI